jgi:subtilisin family serine protease
VVDHEKVDAAVRRLPRRATAATAAGLAVACVVLTAAPAVADQVRSQEWWLRALHVTTAQESSKGSGVTVAVLDTGVNPTQPDLAGSVTTGPDYTASGRKAGGPFWGISGTAVASLIAGHGHGPQNGDGIIGVAPAAKILSVRVTLEGNDPNLTKAGVAAGLPVGIAEGIRYAVSHGAQVIDLPLDPAALAAATPGGGTPTGGSTAAAPTPGGSTAERDAVAYALSKNVVLVAPGGDGGTGTDTVNYPAAYPNVISVGAFNQNFTKAPYTSHRPYVTLTAAGDGVIAATPTGYAMLHSTSAASAVVAGIAALIRAQFPTLRPAQVTSALTQSTVFRPPGGLRNGSGHGTADAQAALLAAAHINAAVPANSGSGGAVVAPSSPVVHPRGTGIYGTVRYAALGLAALLVLGLLGFLIAGRARRRRARLAPLRAVSRVAVRAQPDFSAVPPAAGAQFADSQITRPQSNRPQFPRSPFPGAQVPGAQVPEGQVSGGPGPGGTGLRGATPRRPVPGGPVHRGPVPWRRLHQYPVPRG